MLPNFLMAQKTEMRQKLKESLAKQNAYNLSFQKEGFWYESSTKEDQIGIYKTGKKNGFWLSLDENAVLHELVYFADNQSVFVLSFDTLHTEVKFTTPRESKPENQLGIKEGKYFTDSLFDSIQWRFKIQDYSTVSIFRNKLLIDFNINENEQRFLEFTLSSENNLKGQLALTRLAQLKNARYEGTHYIRDLEDHNIAKIQFKNGWLDGFSTLFENDSLVGIANFKDGILKEYSIVEFDDSYSLEKVTENRKSALFYLARYLQLSQTYYGIHYDCESCAKEMFGGLYGVNINSFKKDEIFFMSLLEPHSYLGIHGDQKIGSFLKGCLNKKTEKFLMNYILNFNL